MRKKPKVTSRILNAVHETARDLHTAGFIDMHRMRQYDAPPVVVGHASSGDALQVHPVRPCCPSLDGESFGEWTEAQDEP